MGIVSFFVRIMSSIKSENNKKIEQGSGKTGKSAAGSGTKSGHEVG